MKCDIVRDLLPLYIDRVCSEETEKEVEAHLDCCETCRAVHRDMALSMTPPEAPKGVPDETAIYRGIRQKIGKLLLCALLFVALMGLSFGMIAEIGEHGWPQGMFAIGFFVPCAAFLLSMIGVILLGRYAHKMLFCWISGIVSALLCLAGDVICLVHYQFPTGWQDCVPFCVAMALVFGGMTFCIAKLYSRFCNR